MDNFETQNEMEPIAEPAVESDGDLARTALKAVDINEFGGDGPDDRVDMPDGEDAEFAGLEESEKKWLRETALFNLTQDLLFDTPVTPGTAFWALRKSYEGRDDMEAVIQDAAKEAAVVSLELSFTRDFDSHRSAELLRAAAGVSRVNPGEIVEEAVHNTIGSGQKTSPRLDRYIANYDIDTTSEEFRKTAKMGAIRALISGHDVATAVTSINQAKIPLDDDINAAANICREYLEKMGRPLGELYRSFQPIAKETNYTKLAKLRGELGPDSKSLGGVDILPVEQKNYYGQFQDKLLEKTRKILYEKSSEPYKGDLADFADSINDIQVEKKANRAQAYADKGSFAMLTRDQIIALRMGDWEQVWDISRSFSQVRSTDENYAEKEILIEDGRSNGVVNVMRPATEERRLDLGELGKAKAKALCDIYDEYVDDGARMLSADFRVERRKKQEEGDPVEESVTPYLCVIFPHPNRLGWCAICECATKEETGTYATFIETVDDDADAEVQVDAVIEALCGGKDEARRTGKVCRFNHHPKRGFHGREKRYEKLGNNAEKIAGHIEYCIENIPRKARGVMRKRQLEHSAEAAA